MWNRRAQTAAAAVLGGLLLIACGDTGQYGLGPPEIELRYHGSSPDRPLEAFILHTELNNYDEADSLLLSPLEVGEATTFEDIPTGTWYLTVIRKQRPLPDSPRVALTTASPLEINGGIIEVLVFDDFFRIMDPVPNNDATE